jgi:hypothetical protein
MIPGAHVIRYLESRGIACALIGGAALSAHGIARSTLDTDLLVADPAVLDPTFWAEVREAGAPEIRHGDADDPLRGVVRLSGNEEAVDVIVGRVPWTRHILARRIQIVVSGCPLPVVDRADLVLLKLFAGGPQDLLDVELLLAGVPTLQAEVEARLSEAPAPVGAAWHRLGKS